MKLTGVFKDDFALVIRTKNKDLLEKFMRRVMYQGMPLVTYDEERILTETFGSKLIQGYMVKIL